MRMFALCCSNMKSTRTTNIFISFRANKSREWSSRRVFHNVRSLTNKYEQSWGKKNWNVEDWTTESDTIQSVSEDKFRGLLWFLLKQVCADDESECKRWWSWDTTRRGRRGKLRHREIWHCAPY
jgi:hypothetical protein